MPKSEIANLVQAFGEDVLQETAHELLAIEAADAPAVGLAVLVAEGDGAFVEGGKAGIGDSDAKDVAREVAEEGVFSLAPTGDLDNPRRGPDGRWDDQIGTLLCKPGLELAAHELGDGRLRGEVGGACGMPTSVVARDAATGNEAMHVGVIVELL